MASISGYDRSNVTIETEDLDKGGIREVVKIPDGRILVYLRPLLDGCPILHLDPVEALVLAEALLHAVVEAARS